MHETKNFLAKDNLFFLKYPINWDYKFEEKRHHFYSQKIASSGLILSIMGTEPPLMLEHILANPKLVTKKLGNSTLYEIDLRDSTSSHNIITWIIKNGSLFLLGTYTYDTENGGTNTHTVELEHIYNIIGSLKVLDETEKNNYLVWDKLEKLTDGLLASNDLYRRAAKHGSFIECVCILANQIDALLRTAIILDDQIKGKHRDIDIKMIYQGKNDKPIFEKAIYDICKERNIISKAVYEALFELYEKRNMVVHRYIISEITTGEVFKIAMLYATLYDNIFELVVNLEKKQIELNVGMTKSDTNSNQQYSEKMRRLVKYKIRDKHGGIEFPKE